MTDGKLLQKQLEKALENYRERTGNEVSRPCAALFDMDGVLYDSMPNHAKAWMMMCRENAIEATEEEFFLYEGRTGASTLQILFNRNFNRDVSSDEVERLYGRKTEFFRQLPTVPVMKGAPEAIHTCVENGIITVLVTGSGQMSILERLERDFPGIFPPERRVTARDVAHGKPHPEPFIKGRLKAGVSIPENAVVAVDNAPMGVRSASPSGAFTIGVRTGPIESGVLISHGADIELSSMEECSKVIEMLVKKLPL